MPEQPVPAETLPKNAIVVLLDSLNRHMLGSYGSREFATPHLDRFAQRALRFEKHYAGALPCIPARHDILCGALDFLWKPWGSIEIWEQSIASALREADVTTMLISDHPHLFETGGENFHTLDVFPNPDPANAPRPQRNQVGLFHIAFEVASYADLREAYRNLIAHDVTIDHATDHVSQRSIYFADPDGNRLEIYYEMPDALARYVGSGRGDQDAPLAVTGPGEPLPAWLDEDWPALRRGSGPA